MLHQMRADTDEWRMVTCTHGRIIAASYVAARMYSVRQTAHQRKTIERGTDTVIITRMSDAIRVHNAICVAVHSR